MIGQGGLGVKGPETVLSKAEGLCSLRAVGAVTQKPEKEKA